MRVMHVAESTRGGVGSYLDEIVDYQADAFGRDNLRFLVPLEDGSPFRRECRADLVRTFSRNGRTISGLSSLAMTALQELRRFRPHLVHIHSSFAGAVVRPLMSRLFPDITTVYCPHGWSFGMEVSLRKKVIYAGLESRLCRNTDLVILNSRSEARLARQFGVTCPSMKVIANAVAQIDGAKEAFSKRTVGDTLRLGFIGRFDMQKGLDILLEVFKRVQRPDIELHVIGAEVAGCDFKASQLQQPGIVCHGWLARSDVFALLGSFDAIIMPSRWEAMPLVAIEALQFGVPVIGSDRGGIPEVIRDGRDGIIFTLDDLEGLTDLIQSLSPTQLAAMGRSARARYLQSFTLETMNRNILQAYDAVLSRETKRISRGRFRVAQG